MPGTPGARPLGRPGPSPHAARETLVVHASKAGLLLTNTTTASAKARAAGRGRALCAAEKRRSAGLRAKRASSIILAAIVRAELAQRA